jgi:hypothetical protein
VGRILLSIVLGLFAPVAAFMVGGLVEVPGQNPPQETIAASLGAFVFLALSQFLTARIDARRPGASWPTTLGLAVPLLAIALVADARNLGQRASLYGPIVLAGWLGILAGALIAARVTLATAPLGMCRRNLRACGALMGGVALVIAGGMAPLSRADAFFAGPPARALLVFWVFAIFHVLAAADLMSVATRVGRGLRPSPTRLGFLALLAFALACFLAPFAGRLTYGFPVVMVGVLGVLCSAADFGVAAVLGSTALRLPSEQVA